MIVPGTVSGVDQRAGQHLAIGSFVDQYAPDVVVVSLLGPEVSDLSHSRAS